MRRIVLIGAAIGLAIAASCGGDDNAGSPTATGGGGAPTSGGGAPSTTSAGGGGTAGIGGSMAGSGGSATDGGALRPCLDRPDQLDRPPTDQLPCDLIPPSFAP
jgi:hypothetical protein